METTHASHNDAELTLRLYDLRRETEMRKARNWFAGQFWPSSFSEIEQTMMQFDSQQSHWFRQVLSYWDMAASLVVNGAYNPELFYATCGEAWFCYAKLKPFVQESRTKFSPEFLINLEKAIEGTPQGRERLKAMLENVANFRRKIEEEGRQKKTAA